MKKELISLLEARIAEEITAGTALSYLKTRKLKDYIDVVIENIYLYTRGKHGPHKQIYMVEMISAIGHAIRNKFGLLRDSANAAKTGAFFLYSFEQFKMISVNKGAGANGHAAYLVTVVNDECICTLWNGIGIKKTLKMPALTPYANWTATEHSTGMRFIKTGNKEVLDNVRPTTHPILFDCLNRAQKVGWQVNKHLLDLCVWGLKNKVPAFADIWEAPSQEARLTKLREARAIGDMAKRLQNQTFYHLYFYDFRGRKYCTTAYLHEQGSDLSRGLLLRADRKPIGLVGYHWLLRSIASTWAGDAGRGDGTKTDKLTMLDRQAWTLANEEMVLTFAENPKINQGWMQADKPWQFIAACYELLKLRTWQYENGSFSNYDYASGLECYIDGSTNGSQHLTALTKDEVTAPYVNLVPTDKPGDLYAYVAASVWDRIETAAAVFSEDELVECNAFIDQLLTYKQSIGAAEPKSTYRKELVDKVLKFKTDNKMLLEISAPLFWQRIQEPKQRRKIVKRNVMTIPYGGTAYGLGNQQNDDSKKHGISLLLNMEHRWGAYMGRLVYDDAKRSLKRSMQLLSIFENAGAKAEKEGRFLRWNVPVTNFPVIQNYTQGRVKKVWVQYGPPVGAKTTTGYYGNTLQLAVCHIEDTIPSKGKQSQGASPNIIHSLDAAHLALTVYKAEYPITTIHDSYGCLLADMENLFSLIRETFVELYESDPLTSILNDIGEDISQVDIGNLDINLVKKSEYCFA